MFYCPEKQYICNYGILRCISSTLLLLWCTPVDQKSTLLLFWCFQVCQTNMCTVLACTPTTIKESLTPFSLSHYYYLTIILGLGHLRERPCTPLNNASATTTKPIMVNHVIIAEPLAKQTKNEKYHVWRMRTADACASGLGYEE